MKSSLWSTLSVTLLLLSILPLITSAQDEAVDNEFPVDYNYEDYDGDYLYYLDTDDDEDVGVDPEEKPLVDGVPNELLDQPDKEDDATREKRWEAYSCKPVECNKRCQELLKVPEGRCGPRGICYCNRGPAKKNRVAQ